MQRTSQVHNHGKYDNGEGGYFWLDDDNNMSYIYIYIYILSIFNHLYWLPVEHIKSIYCNENKR